MRDLPFSNDWFVIIAKPLCDWRFRQENRDDGWTWSVLEMIDRFDSLQSILLAFQANTACRCLATQLTWKLLKAGS